MNDRMELFTIGQLAQRTGLSVRTIRFWSDIDIIPPTSRSMGGYRLYDAEAVARLDLVRTLREFGLDHRVIRQVLTSQSTLSEVIRAHVHALDAQMRSLQVRRAVLRSVVQRESTTEEIRLMHKLARLSAQERQQLIDDFVNRTFEGIDPEAPGAHIATAMRQLPAALPDEPTSEQVDAWLELAELVSDTDFQQRVRQMAMAGAQPVEEPAPQAVDPAVVMEHAGHAVDIGIDPGSAEAGEILRRIAGPDMGSDERIRLADQLETFADRRVERYWQLMGVLNGRPPIPSSVAPFEWLIAALRARS